ncbi:MAG: chromosome segregation protein SMC [Mycobacteriales bacterium]|nr:chromosome segregation protein SMC [Frankia sp.]
MYLKSLTLRGFKSFASSTTLRFEPGITCVVGPNGSGKSNVVDAIAWVLGEQGAKSLRGGKMEDVIFAGTPGRPALGRAEVVLTIDNSDGALPIDYTEVSISRLMFRSGESEYSINGAPCRLLDVQELLSDSGIGRELHVIVGQGQLDAILSARPEDRRGFIEEAAGVLKHRKRKEKALRKLDAMAANMTRLTDLTNELRRQLKPLGKQAEIARRAAAIQAELRDARLRLLADDLLALRAVADAERRDEESVRARRSAAEAALAEADERERTLEAALADETPLLARAQETYYRLSAVRDRLRGTADLAAERHRHLGADVDAEVRPGRSAAELDAEAASVREEERAVRAALAVDEGRLAAAAGARAALETALAEAETSLVTATRAQADRREGLARLTGEVGALRSRAAAAEQEIGRLTAAHAAALERAGAAADAYAALQRQITDAEAGELGLDARYERVSHDLAEATVRVEQLLNDEREVEREKSFWSARHEALELSLRRRDGAGALLDPTTGVGGVVGSVASLLDVAPGYETAIAAALGTTADAVAVEDFDAATRAIAKLKSAEAGRASLLIGGADYAEEPAWPALPDGVQWAIDLVGSPAALRPAVATVLRRVAVVDDLPAARELVEREPGVTAVTRDGDVLAASTAVGGGASAPSTLEVQAALDEAATRSNEATMRGERLRFALVAARTELDQLQVDVDEVLGSLHESDAKLAAVAEELARHGSHERSAREEAERLAAARAEAEAARDEDLAGLTALEQRLAEAEAAPLDLEPSTESRDRAAAELAAARSAELDVRLATVAAEERARALAARAESLEHAADAERSARERLVVVRETRRLGAAVAADVARVAGAALDAVDRALLRASAERDRLAYTRETHERDAAELRGLRRELSAEVESLTNVAHRDELARAEQQMRIEALEVKAVEDYGVGLDVLTAEYAPTVLVPPAPDAPEGAEPTAYDRAAVEKRAAAADRQLALLGRVNPLALEEFSALEERHAFLASQLEDLKATRRDLLTVVREVDDRMRQVFLDAFHDTAREFEHVFATLFPGGEGRLVLTDPDDPLTTGVEVEARPPGKRIKRLSLLSGGERSLTAIALLVAIFRARPSPFYILDEIEAALDDRNLSRLLDLLTELRAASQLIVITHQKRTMEIADSLYGVSMRGDGISAVISQRLREREDVGA